MPLRGLRLSDDLKTRLEQVQKVRGYRSVNAFTLEAIEEKLQRMDAIESVSESEARIAADFSRIVREVRSVHNTQQAQYALLDALTKYVSTCVVEPPQDLLVSARAQGWAVRSRLRPMLEVARTLKRRFENIITYLRHRVTNAASESINAKIQWVKYTARGFRNKKNFAAAILFHCGGLNLAP